VAGAAFDADAATAIADLSYHVTLLEARDLHGEIGVDAAAARLDVDVGALGRRETDGYRA
jgi:hypothetical protein